MSRFNKNWGSKVRYRALKATAEQYHISTSEVKELLLLADEYLQAQIQSIDLEGDLYTIPTRIQIPGFRNYLNVHKSLVLKSMYDRGYFTEEQWAVVLQWHGKRLSYLEKGILMFKTKYDESRIDGSRGD